MKHALWLFVLIVIAQTLWIASLEFRLFQLKRNQGALLNNQQEFLTAFNAVDGAIKELLMIQADYADVTGEVSP